MSPLRHNLYFCVAGRYTNDTVEAPIKQHTMTCNLVVVNTIAIRL